MRAEPAEWSNERVEKNSLWCKDRDAEHIKIKLAMMIRDGHGKNVKRPM